MRDEADNPDNVEQPAGSPRGAADREARLAEALRANLRRRKAQARGDADRDDGRG